MWSRKATPPAYHPLALSDDEDLPLGLKLTRKPRATVLAYARRRGLRTTLLLLLAGLSCLAFSHLPVDALQSRLRDYQRSKSLNAGFQIPPDSPFLADDLANNWTPFNASDSDPFLPDPVVPHSASKSIPERIFNAACADRFIAQGTLCDASAFDRQQLKLDARLSVLYAYENGSDPILGALRNSYIGLEQVQGHARDARHFRVHNELQYSLRSVVRAFKNRWAASLASFHLMTTDLPDLPFLESDSPSALIHQSVNTRPPWRWGFKPSWLRNDHLHHKHMTIAPEYPWRFFQTHNLSRAEAQQWREAALPSFQSMSIESSIPHVRTKTDIALGLCDDFFFMQEMAPADVGSPLFGNVYHLQNHLLVQPATAHQFHKGHNAMDGEWGSLGYSETLLDARFGAKKRPYPTHHFKSFNMPVMREISYAFADELRETGQARFRGHGAATEVNMAFLAINWNIERAREALLWSFIVGKSDTNGDGLLDEDEKLALIDYILQASVVKSEELESDRIAVGRPHRASPQDVVQPALDKAGLEQPKQTKYEATFATHGYAYLANVTEAEYEHQHYDQWNKGGWADFTGEAPNEVYCELPLSCFEAPGIRPTTNDLFKQIAFEKTECGNCLTAALLKLSGKQGFEAFLPSPSAASPSSQRPPQDDGLAHLLPVTKSWQDSSFGLSDVVPRGQDLRTFCVRLLQRYAWVVGDISVTFMKMSGPRETEFKLRAFQSWDEEPRKGGKKVALLALNDDIKTDRWSQMIDKTLQQFFDKHFSEPLDWEA